MLRFDSCSSLKVAYESLQRILYYIGPMVMDYNTYSLLYHNVNLHNFVNPSINIVRYMLSNYSLTIAEHAKHCRLGQANHYVSQALKVVRYIQSSFQSVL